MKNISKQCFVTINFAIVVLEITSFVLRFVNYEQNMFLYFTVLSNLVATVVCAFCGIRALKIVYHATLYQWSTCLVAFTLVVMTIGANGVDGGYYQMFCVGACLLNHLACPLLMIINYLVFLPKCNNAVGCWWAVMTILVYGTTMCLLNAFGVVVGPYFFFEVHSMSFGTFLLLLFALVGVCFATTFAIYFFKAKIDKTKLVAK